MTSPTGAPLAIIANKGMPQGASRRPPTWEVIQQMHCHHIAALVRSDVDTTEVSTS
jgi:hypothetical protein